MLWHDAPVLLFVLWLENGSKTTCSVLSPSGLKIPLLLHIGITFKWTTPKKPTYKPFKRRGENSRARAANKTSSILWEKKTICTFFQNWKVGHKAPSKPYWIKNNLTIAHGNHLQRKTPQKNPPTNLSSEEEKYSRARVVNKTLSILRGKNNDSHIFSKLEGGS